MKISKILVAVDGSDSSIKAADYALDLAGKNDAEVVAVTVLDISSVFITVPQETRKRITAIEKRDSLKIFAQIKEMAKERGLDIKTKAIGSSSPAEVILKYAKKENVDLIVVGTKGRSKMNRVLLGSVASKIVTDAPCSVLVIR